ncbi:MAG: hypothetical protein AAGF31_11320, partial [Planctomycetota bacterium]
MRISPRRGSFAILAKRVAGAMLAALGFAIPATAVTVTTTAELVDAINNGAAGDTITLAAGTFELTTPLKPKAGMSIVGAGAGQTVLTAAPSFVPTDATIRDTGVDANRIDRTAYLFSPDNGTDGLTIAGMTMHAPALHGAYFGDNTDDLVLRDNEFNGFRWSAVRTFRVNNGKIHDNDFIDAGNRTGITSGGAGGAIFNTFFAGNEDGMNEVYNNRFTKTAGYVGNYFGVKGRQFRDTRIYNNTIDTSFAIELPFENDFGVEITGNFLDGVVSIPKGGDGTEPQNAGGVDRPVGEGVAIRNNYFTRAYSIEGPRKGVLVDNNLFDIDAADDGGNLIANFGSRSTTGTPGPLTFSNNRVSNPGRGIFWADIIHNHLTFANNHIIADETAPYTLEGGVAPGLIGLKPDRMYTFNLDPARPYRINVEDERIEVDAALNITITDDAGPVAVMDSDFLTVAPDGTVLITAGVNSVTLRTDGTGTVEEFTEFDTITVANNRIEVLGDPRPLFRNTPSYGATVVNNELTNIEDAALTGNTLTGDPIGPTTSGRYFVGVDGEYLVDGFTIALADLMGDFNLDGVVDVA